MNDDLLVLQYPAYENKINEARKAGYNDEEIGSAMNSRIESALANGYTRYEIDERLGITDDSRFAHLNALIRSKQNAVGFIQNKTPEQMESIFKSNRKKGIDLNKTLHMVDLSSLNDETAVSRYLESLGTPKYKEADRDRGPAFEWNKKLNESAGALTKNLYTRTVGGITAGFLSSAEGMSRGGAFLSDVLGYEDGYKKASEFADFLESGTEGYMSMLYKDRDINLLDSVMQGIGSNGMFLFAGITASKLIGYAGGTALLAGAKIQTVEKLARYAGASIQATTESLSEAGGVYKEVLDRTGDKSAAMSAASWNFWLNMPSNFLSDKFAFWGEDTFLKGVLPKVAKSATMQNVLYKGAKAAAGLVSEGAQETFQGAIGEHYGKGTDWTALDLSEIAYQQGLPGGIVGAIMGYGMSPKFQAMVTEHNERIAQKERIIHVRDVGTVVQNVKTELLKTGRDEETANVESAIWGARASTAAKQQGITPMEWLERQGLSVKEGIQSADGYRQSIGEKGAAALDAFNSATERLDDLDFARMLESEGFDALSVKQQTNWERGADGKWRYETDDSKFALKAYPGSEAWRNSFSNKDDYSSQPFAFLKDIVLHDELLTAYPYLGDIKVYIDLEDKNTLGYYSPTDNAIHLNYDTANDFNETRKTLMHEVQHVIQDNEGFASGGNSKQAARELGLNHRDMKEKARSIVARDEKFKDEHKHEYEEFIAELDKYSEIGVEYYIIQEKFKEKYPEYAEIQNLISDFMSIVGAYSPKEFLANKVKPSEYAAAYNRYFKYAGETEARNTETRMNMTAAERRESLMSATEDVSREDQIVLEDMYVTYYQQEPASEELQIRQRREELISAYDNAIANNDMESATEIVNEYAALNGYTKDSEHKSHHEAPYKDEEGFNFSLADIVAGADNVLSPSDFFTHPNKYISMNESESVESLNAVKAAIEAENKFRSGKTKKEPTITVYRAVPQNVDESSPRNADWVTPSKKYAKLHGEKVFNGQYKIQSMKVKASDLYWNADSINEWGVDDGQNYGYKNTENNRKLFDAVTYDGNGKVIPLAQRFNDEMKETYYQPLNNDVNPDDMVDFVDLRGVKEFKIDTSNAKAFVAKWNDSGLEIRKNISGDKATAKLYSKNKKHIVWSSYIPGRHGKERRKALTAFDKVLNGAVMIETFKNKKSDKQDIEFVHRFYLPIITEEGESLLRIVALEKNNTSRVSDVELYDITKEKTPLTSPTHGINANTQLNEQIRTLGSKISIRDLLKNVKDSNGDRYFRQEDLAEQPYRASVTFQDGKSLVSMMKTADRSSFLHESGHIFLKDMADFINSGKASEQDIADWNTLLEWFGVTDWNDLSQEERIKAHEQFARGIESYFWNGVSPVKSLVGVFNKFSAWLREIYKSVQELNVEMSPDVNDVFNRLFAVDDVIGDVVSRKVTDSELMADIAKESEEASSQTEEDTPEDEPRTNAQIDASYDPDWTDEEISAYEAARENARAAVELEDIEYDPAMWDITQENINETFDKQEYGKEQQAMDKAAYQAFIDFGNQILENGGILYSSLVNAVGQEKAQEIRKKVPYLIRNNFKEIGDIASDMGISVGEIVARLDSRPAKPISEKFAPIVEVDTSTVPWILERFGIDGGRRYFEKRLRYIEGMQSEAEKNYSLAKTEDNLQSMERIKQEYKAYVVESKLIKEALHDIESIEKTLEPYSQKASAPITWKEMVEKAKEQAVRWTQVTVKEAIYSVTDKTRVSDLVSEYDAMREAYKMSEQDSRRAFRSGKKDGMIIAAARQKELTKQRLKRAETRRYIMQLVKGIDTATVGNMIFAKKQEIIKILDDYDLKFRSSKTVENRKTILDYIHEGIDEAKKTGDNMSVEFMDFAESELRILSRKTLNNMTIEDLIGLHTKVTNLRREGIKEYRLWEAKNRQELDGMKESLFSVTGGPQSGNTGGIIVPGKTKRGAQISRIGAALLETLTPSRVFDRLDNFADFKGAFHNIFMRNADEAEDSFLRAKNKRLKVMEDIFNTYQMTQAKLAETRLKFTDAESGEETILTLDHCLHIYIGWHNTLTRDALMYGNRISQTVADSAFASLSEDEKNFALAVMNEQGGDNTDRYENVLLDTFNIGLNREKYYTRMYRTQWTNSKGDSVDEGIKGILDSLAMEYSIRKIYADKGSSKDRRIISELYQEPIALGLVNVWNRSMVEHEHLIAYGKLVKQLHAIVNEQTDRNKAEHVAGMKETIENVYGTDVQRWIVGYVNRLANPDFYKSFKASDQMMRKVRANVGVAYLWCNISTVFKQPVSLAYYLRDAGLVHLVSSIAEFTAHPVRTMEMVWELDPQVKDQKINRFLEELKVSNEDGQLGKIKKYGEWGFAPMQWTDMLTRCIGWNAVYKNELAKGSSQKDAAYAAQRATLNTQNAAHPKELPSYMATGNEMLNLMTQFTNQANKIFGVAVHELYGDFKKGRYHKGFLTLMSLFIGAYLMSLLKNGENPADSKEAFKRLFVEETLGNIPLMGSGFQAYASGFSGGATPYDDVASDLAKALFKGFDNEFEDSAMALYTAWSILLGGTPVTAVKRAIKFAETGDLSDLTGLLRRHKSKKSIVL